MTPPCELAALLRSAALLLEQQSSALDYAQAAEGRIAELEAITAQLQADVAQLREIIGTAHTQAVHRLVERVP